jgi:2-keto-4-pentenoate hydratase/2-oxohepta-3-ene-1,7-dioic acid hydratase in catechol pathway
MKIICIGRNYALHAKEMGSDLPKKPIFFLKPDTALLRNNEPFYYPDFSNEIHYEVEIVLRISKMGKNISEKFAHRYFNEIGIGIDFTARDLQREAKEKGLPWATAKAFDFSAPISPTFIPKDQFQDIYNIDFHLEKNGKTVQKGNTKDLIFKFEFLISYISKFITLRTGDLIFTGTPQGVGPVAIGDNLKAYIHDQLLLDFDIK